MTFYLPSNYNVVKHKDIISIFDIFYKNDQVLFLARFDLRNSVVSPSLSSLFVFEFSSAVAVELVVSLGWSTFVFEDWQDFLVTLESVALPAVFLSPIPFSLSLISSMYVHLAKDESQDEEVISGRYGCHDTSLTHSRWPSNSRTISPVSAPC